VAAQKIFDMEAGLTQIARLVDGRIIGNPKLRIHGINTIDEATEGEMTFISNPSYYKKALTTHASAILSEKAIPNLKKTLLLVKNPKWAMAQVLRFFHPSRHPVCGIDPRAVIGMNVTFGKGVSISPNVVIEEGVKIGNDVHLAPGVFVGQGSEIGDQSVLHPNVTVYDRIQIGRRVIIHSGSVVGADGFGFVSHESRQMKVPQVGTVIIEDDVELGANVTIDRATIGVTRIGTGTKFDNQVHVGHNVEIGPHSLIVAQVGIAGSVKLGHHVILAGQAGVIDHVEIGDHAVVGVRSLVTKDIRAQARVTGFPAVPHKEWLIAQSSFQHLPALRKEVKTLNKKIVSLEKQLAELK
jgi:UDP-3-O-[3-hydroxymyristoyl] glucosamine N-acyltransferase